MEIDGDLIEIHLRNKETAYLVPVAFGNRGRNDIWTMAMVRPALRQVREVGFPVSRDVEVHDFDNDGVSEVIAVSLGSGQGITMGQKSIVQFNGWIPVVLHKAKFEEAHVFTDQEHDYERSVSWKFVDLDGDGSLDLIEEITTSESTGNRPSVPRKVTHKFLFKGSKFVRAKDARPAGKGYDNG